MGRHTVKSTGRADKDLQYFFRFKVIMETSIERFIGDWFEYYRT